MHNEAQSLFRRLKMLRQAINSSDFLESEVPQLVPYTWPDKSNPHTPILFL
jgi:hypothetical protein